MSEQSPFTEDAALHAIVEGGAAETGDQFFHSLVRQLAAALGVQYVLCRSLARTVRVSACAPCGNTADSFLALRSLSLAPLCPQKFQKHSYRHS